MKNNFIYKILAIFLIVVIVVIPFFRVDGGLVDDDYYYFKIAESLPDFNQSIFPIGYPIILRLVNLIFNDYFLSSRFIAVSSFTFIIYFSYFKKFFFKETVILMCLKFFTIFFYALSETLFIPIFYILFYALYNIIINEKDKFFLLAICIFLLVTIRYSGLFVWGGISLYFVFYYFFFNNKNKSIVGISLIKSLFLSALLIFIFLMINLYFTGAFFGENQRGDSILYNSNGLQFLIKSILFPFFIAINPISEIYRFSQFSFFITLLLASLFSIIFIILFLKNLRNQNIRFLILLLIIMLVYFIGLIYSSYTTGIEAMHFRLNLPIVFILFFYILIYVKNKIGKQLILLSACLSMFVNIYFNIENSFNYLEKRSNVIRFYKKKGCTNYYVNDINVTPTETGGVLTSNFFTLYCINPNIKKIDKKDNVKPINIIFEKELVNIEPVNKSTYSNSFSVSK